MPPSVSKLYGPFDMSISSAAVYDETGSFLTAVTGPLGTTTSYSYLEDRGLSESVTSPTGERVWYEYDDDSDRLKEVKQELSRLRYEYTAAGLPSRIRLSGTDPEGIVYEMSYDEFGNRLSTAVAGEVLAENTYEPSNGNLISTAYGNGAVLSMTYDNLDRVIAKTWAGHTPSTVTYDKRGAIYRATDGLSGITTTFDYDLFGRLLASKSSNGLCQQVAYDSCGRPASSTYSFGSGDVFKTDYLFGDIASGQHKSMLYGLSVNGVQKLAYGYDRLSRLTKRSLGNSMGYTTTYRYLDNADSGTTSLLAGITNGTDAELTYTYDSYGQITEIYEGGILMHQYEYSYGRLKREYDAVRGIAMRYCYDSLGNLDCTETYSCTEPWDMDTPIESRCYFYCPDRKDQLIGMQSIIYTPQGTTFTGPQDFAYDEIGCPLTYGDITMAWDFGRRLVAITDTIGLDVTYTYSDGGIRTSKTVDSETTTYTLSGAMILRQEDSTDRLDFSYDERGQLYGFSYNNAEYWYIRDGQGDICGIIDDSGIKVVSYTYDTWGAPQSVTGPLAATIGVLNPFRYRGYYYDSETGFYYLNSRYYDPSIRRFINADGAVSTGQGIAGYNMYAYCLNNPVMLADGSGRAAGKAGVRVSGKFLTNTQANDTDTGTVYVVINPSFGPDLGHAAIMFEDPTTGQLNLYSFLPVKIQFEANGFIATQIHPNTFESFSHWAGNGVGILSYNPDGGRWLEQYDRYIRIEVSLASYQAMQEMANELVGSIPKYNFAAFNCLHYTEKILAAGGVSMSDTIPSTVSYVPNLYFENSMFISGAINVESGMF